MLAANIPIIGTFLYNSFLAIFVFVNVNAWAVAIDIKLIANIFFSFFV